MATRLAQRVQNTGPVPAFPGPAEWRDRPFLLSSRGALTRAEVAAAAGQLAQALRQAGMGQGAVMAIAADDPLQAVIGFLGVLVAGGTAVPLRPGTPVGEGRAILSDAGADAIVTDDSAGAADMAQGLTVIPVSAGAVRGAAGDLPGLAETGHGTGDDPDRALAILYTSGTTGRPKGVIYARRTIEAVARIHGQEFFRTGPDDTILMTAPLVNNYGLTFLFTALATGARLSLPDSFGTRNLVRAIERDHVTFVAGVPSLGQLLLQATEGMDNPLPSLRRMLMAGTTLFPDLAEALERRFGIELMNGYGMTEGAPIAFATDWKQPPPGAVGRVQADTELRIVGPDMADLPPGEIGEILVRGPQVTPGYWRAPDLTARSFVDGWLRTGDAGKLDPQGYLHVLDRLKDVIKTGGRTVYPAETEAVLRTHPDVLEAAVIGIPHKVLGEVVVAFVRPRQDRQASSVALIRWCRQRLSREKVPLAVRSVTSFPMTPTGKIAKRELRRSFLGKGGGA